MLARSTGQLSLALRSLADSGAGNSQPVADERGARRTGISIVRYGVTSTTHCGRAGAAAVLAELDKLK